MIPQMKFSCSPDDKIYLDYVLPALLDGTKGSTIRRAWKMASEEIVAVPIPGDDGTVTDIGAKMMNEAIKDLMFETPPKWKVGDIVEQVWVAENIAQYRDFRRILCENLKEDILIKILMKKSFYEYLGKYVIRFEYSKPNIFEDIPLIINEDEIQEENILLVFGTVRITDVTKVHMGITDTICDSTVKSAYYMAKRDGFPDAETMFRWFDNQVDLSVPRPFWVYGYEELVNG